MTLFRNQVILLEHNAYPTGSVFEDTLIYGGTCGILSEMVNLNEAAESILTNKPLKFRGKFQEADAVNKNKRMYPRTVLETNVKRLLGGLDEGGLCGECDHPADSIIHFREASHKITKLWWEDNVLMGEGYVLNTPCGKILKTLINDGVRIGISSRGVGNGKVNENGVLVIGESYKLITFDAVADPSTYSAFQEKVVSKKETEEHTENYVNSFVKNEDSNIYTNKNLLLACVSGIIKQKSKDIKARLS